MLSSDGAEKIDDYDQLRKALDAVFYQRVGENLEAVILNAIPYFSIPPTCSKKTTDAANKLQQDGAEARAADANLEQQ